MPNRLWNWAHLRPHIVRNESLVTSARDRRCFLFSPIDVTIMHACPALNWLRVDSVTRLFGVFFFYRIHAPDLECEIGWKVFNPKTLKWRFVGFVAQTSIDPEIQLTFFDAVAAKRLIVTFRLSWRDELVFFLVFGFVLFRRRWVNTGQLPHGN